MDPDGSSEATLWQRSLQGDARAFGALFEAHRDAVFRQALRVTGRLEEAEEVVAVAFLELWRLRDRARLVDGSVLPWLLVTSLNVARNFSRSARRYRALLARLPEPPEHSDAGAATLEAMHRSQALRAALGRLSRADQRLVALVLLGDVPVPAAAAALGLQERTARNRVSLIRRRLQADLGELRPSTRA